MITWRVNQQKTLLMTPDREIVITCNVRNELNKRRGGADICHCVPTGKPVMPRPFPSGKFLVGKAKASTNPYTAPYFITTNATEWLPVWSLNKYGYYEAPTSEMTLSSGYGIHCSTSSTTLGCLRVAKVGDLMYLVDVINSGETIYLEVL